MNWVLRWVILFGLGVSVISPIAYSDNLVDVYRNHNIPLIDNRFRIDPKVTEVTFLLQRKPGSAPAILVRPDGSKIYPWKFPKGDHWLETSKMDIVTLKNPMPGPWQALVSYQGQNAIKVVSNVKLHVEPFPLQVFVGERLSLKAQLLNQGKPLIFGPYMDNVLLHVTLDSLGSTQDDNFAFAHTKLAALRDDGKAFDGYPRDGTYTGYVELEVPAGKYTLRVMTQNGVFTRAYQQMLLVSHQPYQVELLPPKDTTHKARIKVAVDADEIKPDSLVINGIIRNDLKWKKHFQIRTRKVSRDHLFVLPTPTQPGSYRIEALVYATTLGGRPVVMRMPVKTFYVLAPPPPPVVKKTPEVKKVKPEPSHWLLWTILVVVLILVMGAGLFGFVWWHKRQAFKKALADASAGESEEIHLESQSTTPEKDEPQDAPGLESEPDLTKEEKDE